MSATEGRRMLGPLRSRASWVASGLILQAVGAGGMAAYVGLKGRHQNIGGEVAAAGKRPPRDGGGYPPRGVGPSAGGGLLSPAGWRPMAPGGVCPATGRLPGAA